MGHIQVHGTFEYSSSLGLPVLSWFLRALPLHESSVVYDMLQLRFWD